MNKIDINNILIEKFFPIRIIIEEYSNIQRVNEPITFGIPLPKGTIYNANKIEIFDNKNKSLPLQYQILSRWHDESIKWIIFDFQITVDAKEIIECKLDILSDHVKHVKFHNINIKKQKQNLIIDTNYALFYIDNNILKPFNNIIIGGVDVIKENTSNIFLTDEFGQIYRPHVCDLTVETAGSLRTVLRIEGEFLGKNHNKMANFISRLSFYAGSGFVEMKLTLHNPRAARHPGGLWDLGDEGSIYFQDLALHVDLGSNDDVAVEWTPEPEQPLAPVSGEHLEIYQDSSGGQNWRSTNHVNRFGRVMHTFQGYRTTVDGRIVQEGKRATPVVAVHDRERSIVASIDKFWQNFPKAIEVKGNRLSIRLFPHQYQDVHELQGGEQKTHTIVLQFDRRQRPVPEVGWFHNRLLPRVTPEWYAGTNAFRYLTPQSMDTHRSCQELIDTAIEGDNTFFDRREIIDEYGWRNFGEIYADHETVGHQGDAPLVSHYNNQYDVIYGVIVQYVRSGDPRWFHLMNDLAKHVIDIDIYHTREDRPSYNGGLFWHTDHYTDAGTATHRTYSKKALETKNSLDYGGGPSNEHNYTTGLLHYYFLTGDPTAREAVQELADWVISMDDGSQRLFGRFDKRPTGLCSSTVTRDYHGPGRGAGNSINALLDAYRLTGEPQYLVKAEELIRRCIHPKDDIEKRELHDVEHRWSYTVFLQTLGKYLDFKSERGEVDYMYSYARASLLHYAGWMLENEIPYKRILHKVKIPTETWPAQDIRKSNVFKFAAKHADEPLRSIFLQKAEDFFQICITDLLSFETWAFTRPIVLIMTNGYMQAYFDQYPETRAPRPDKEYDFGSPQDFKPQFYELYKVREKLSALVGTVQAVGRRLGGARCHCTSWLGGDHG